MRTFSFKPSLTLKGRKFKGLRGFAGKPFHPPITTIPVGAYIIAPALDIVSFLNKDQAWARDLFRASTFVLICGGIISILAVITGLYDWKKSTEKGTQARRTVNAHMAVMFVLSAIVLAGIIWRLNIFSDQKYTSLGLLSISIVIGVLVAIGGTIGGGLAYDYGFNVETAGDSPVWHKSEIDVMPGEHK
ncbi:MAG: DUF2231 domain-containing protein [Acidimicrobiia bacterium]